MAQRIVITASEGVTELDKLMCAALTRDVCPRRDREPRSAAESGGGL